MAKEGGRDKERLTTPSLNRVFTAPPLFSKWAAEDSRETKGKKRPVDTKKKEKRNGLRLMSNQGGEQIFAPHA